MWAMTYVMVNYLSTILAVSLAALPPNIWARYSLNRVSSQVRPRQNKKTTPLYNVFPNCTPVIISLEHIPGASPGVKLIPRPIWCRPSGGSSSRQWSREMGVDGEHLALLRVSAFNAVVQNTMLSQKDRMGWNVSEACERSMPLEGEKGCRQWKGRMETLMNSAWFMIFNLLRFQSAWC